MIFSSPDQLSRLVGAQAHPAAEPRADPEPADERLAGAARPVLRRRAALLGARTPSTRPGSAGATTSVNFDPAKLDQPGTRSGRRAVRGPRRHPRRLARGARHGADAPRRHRPQHRGPGADRAGREGPAGARPARAREGRRSTSYETLPAGRMWMHQSWSGDLLNAVISYLPKGTSRRRALVLVPGAGRPGLQRLHLRRREGDASR